MKWLAMWVIGMVGIPIVAYHNMLVGAALIISIFIYFQFVDRRS